jgi:hypothetical protein
MKRRGGWLRELVRGWTWRAHERARWRLSSLCLHLCLWLEESSMSAWVDARGLVGLMLTAAEWLEAVGDRLVPEFADPKAELTSLLRPGTTLAPSEESYRYPPCRSFAAPTKRRISTAPNERGPDDLTVLNLPDHIIAQIVFAHAGLTHEVEVPA